MPIIMFCVWLGVGFCLGGFLGAFLALVAYCLGALLVLGISGELQ
jgi:hypothetical protein